MSWSVLVQVHDRPGALERVLALARRRAMPLRPDVIARDGEGRWSIVFSATESGAEIEHLITEFRELHDLEAAIPIERS